MTQIPAGLGATCGMALETAWEGSSGFVAPQLWFPFEKEGLELKKKTVQSQAIWGSRFERASGRTVTELSAMGAVDLELADRSLGGLLGLCLGTTPIVTQIASTTAYQQVIQPGAFYGGSTSASIQIGRPTDAGVMVPFSYSGCKVSDFEISVKRGDYGKLACTFDGAAEQTSPSYDAPSYVGSNLLSFVDAVVTIGGTASETSGLVSVTGGTAVSVGTGFSLKGNNGLDAERYFLGTTYKAEQIPNAFAKYDGQLEAEFDALATIYNDFAADTPVSLQLTFTGQEIGVSAHDAELQIIIPQIRFEGETPKVGGPNVLTVTAPFTVLQNDATTLPAIQVVYVSADTMAW